MIFMQYKGTTKFDKSKKKQQFLQKKTRVPVRITPRARPKGLLPTLHPFALLSIPLTRVRAFLFPSFLSRSIIYYISFILFCVFFFLIEPLPTNEL